MYSNGKDLKVILDSPLSFCSHLNLPSRTFLLELVSLRRVEQVDEMLRQTGVAQAGAPSQLCPQPVRLSQVDPPLIVLLPRLEAPLCAVQVGKPRPAPAPPQDTLSSSRGSVRFLEDLAFRCGRCHVCHS